MDFLFILFLSMVMGLISGVLSFAAHIIIASFVKFKLFFDYESARITAYFAFVISFVMSLINLIGTP